MSTLTTHTPATRTTPSASNIGLCKFNTQDQAIEVSDGTDWLVYDYDSLAVPTLSNTYSASFDGVSDHLYFGTSATNKDITLGTTDFALSLWFYPTSTTQDFLFRDTGGTNRVFILNGTLTIKYGTTISITNAYQVNNWHHLVLERTSGTQKVWINNILKSTVASQTTTFNVASIGYNSSSGYAFEGNIDEMSFHSQGLSATDVSDIYNNGLPRNVAVGFNATGWWRMGDASSGTTITDQVGTENLTADGAILTDTNVPS